MGPKVTDRAVNLANLDDPEFLAARAQVRDQFERAPDDTELAAEYERLTTEFDRRARGAWGQAGPQ